MAKQSRVVKQNQVASHNGRGASFEQHESFDDSLLPDAAELSRLKEIDPTIIDWIKERTAREQESRLELNNRKMDYMERSTNKAYNIDRLTSTYAFLIVIAGMVLSYLLINGGQVITGTVFAGATILYGANLFLNFRKNIGGDDKNK